MSTFNTQLSPHSPKTTQGTSTANNRAFDGSTASRRLKQSASKGFHKATAHVLVDTRQVSADSTDS